MEMGRRRGMSLIELLVVLVIVAVLASQAMPAWQRHVVRARRSEAQAALLQLMQQQERFYSQANSYLAFSSNSTDAEERHFRWWTGAIPATSAFEVEGKACDGELISQCIQLIATPGTSKVDSRFHDDDCQRLTLTSSGLRLASGPAEHCWP